MTGKKRSDEMISAGGRYPWAKGSDVTSKKFDLGPVPGTVSKLFEVEAERDELRAENAQLRGTCEWQLENDGKNAETISRLLAENERLRVNNTWLVELANNLLARLKETSAAHPIEIGVVQAEIKRRVTQR